MSYMKVDDITIPIFDGGEYHNWKKRILKFLQYKKILHVAMRTIQATDKAGEWLEADYKATNFIYSAILNKQLHIGGRYDL